MSPYLPLVSVNVVTYNHEPFIAATVRSVLNQTCKDLEVVVTDDGSTDRTGEVVKAFHDPRVVYQYQKNQGPSAATNAGITRCRGRFVALLSGDDVCHPERLQRQLAEYGRGGRRVLFSRVDFIDDEGAPLSGGHFARGVFDSSNRPRSKILEHFFNKGNYLNAVTGFTERDMLLAEMPYDELLLQLQDFAMWVQLAKKYDFWIMPENLVSYRIRNDHRNLSFPSPAAHAATQNELSLILRNFFDGIPASLFKEAFAGTLLQPDFDDGPAYLCEQAFAYLRSRIPVAWFIGMEKFHGLWHDPRTAAVLREQYQFTAADFYKLLRQVNQVDVSDNMTTTLYVNTGSGWNQEQTVLLSADAKSLWFSLTFDLSRFPYVEAVRWDPVENQHCKIKIDTLAYREPSGTTRRLDPGALTCNSVRSEDGWVTFNTLDPHFLIPVADHAVSLTIQGVWDYEPLRAALNRANCELVRGKCERDETVGELGARLAEKEKQVQAQTPSRARRLLARLKPLAHLVRRSALSGSGRARD